jgi:uncharacterized glyoxalase superfamily protein PhnB
MSDATRFAGGPSNRSIPSATVIPVLYYPDVAAAAAWLCTAFGFSERLRIFTHRIQLTVGDGAVVVADGPGSSAGSGAPSASIMIRVQNADEHCEAAKRAGVAIVNAPETYPFGERQYTATDFAGHVWTFSQTVSNVEPSAWGGEMVGD